MEKYQNRMDQKEVEDSKPVGCTEEKNEKMLLRWEGWRREYLRLPRSNRTHETVQCAGLYGVQMQKEETTKCLTK